MGQGAEDPSVFLSYAGEDGVRAGELAEALGRLGIAVWQDRADLYAGERWPKVLGEAIAGRDALLLVWSAHAGSSTYVELEWCTAIALGKPIVPVRLDDSELPAALAAIQALDLEDLEVTAEAVRGALSEPQRGSRRSESLLGELGRIGAGEPDQVLQAAKKLYREQGVIIDGNVFQAAGDVVVVPAGGGEDRGRWAPLKRVWLGVGVVVGVLSAITLTLSLVDACAPPDLSSWVDVDCYRLDHNCVLDFRLTTEGSDRFHFSRLELEALEVTTEEGLSGHVPVSREYELDIGPLDGAGRSVGAKISQDVDSRGTCRFAITVGVGQDVIPRGGFRTWKVRARLVGPNAETEIAEIGPLTLPWDPGRSTVDPRKIEEF